MNAHQLLVLLCFAIAGAFYLYRYHPNYKRKRKSFAEHHRYFIDDKIELLLQIKDAKNFQSTLDLDMMIHMFLIDHERFIGEAEVKGAVADLYDALHKRQNELRKTPGLFAL